MYEDPVDNVCRKCTGNCKECEGVSTYCTECEIFYELTGENTCEGASFYPFPFLIASFLFTVAISVTIIFKRETRFRESSVALVAWAELGAWVAACAFFAGVG
jgi:hypothetical protein